jgi:hypothetical protein
VDYQGPSVRTDEPVMLSGRRCSDFHGSGRCFSPQNGVTVTFRTRSSRQAFRNAGDCRHSFSFARISCADPGSSRPPRQKRERRPATTPERTGHHRPCLRSGVCGAPEAWPRPCRSWSSGSALRGAFRPANWPPLPLVVPNPPILPCARRGPCVTNGDVSDGEAPGSNDAETPRTPAATRKIRRVGIEWMHVAR